MRLVIIGLAICSAALLPGCNSVRKAASRPPSATVTAGKASVAQDGAAAVPASANVTTTTTAATVPPGARVTSHADGSISWTTAEPLAIVTTRTAESVTGPAAFTPPAPPTPAEEARGFGVRAFYLAALGCALAAGLLLWLRYPLAAICAGGAALALPIVANVVSSGAGVLVGAVLLALGAGLIVAYHLTKAKGDAPRPAPLTPASA